MDAEKILFPGQEKPSIPARITDNNILKIAISGKSGCGNSTVSGLLARELNIALVNYTLRDLAEAYQMRLTDLTDRAQYDSSIDWYIDAKQIDSIQKHACILASRLAIWLVEGTVLSIYLEASPQVRAGRIAKREKDDQSSTLVKMMERDKRDRNRLLEKYNIDIDQYQHADYIINTNTKEASVIVQEILEIEAIQKRRR